MGVVMGAANGRVGPFSIMLDFFKNIPRTNAATRTMNQSVSIITIPIVVPIAYPACSYSFPDVGTEDDIAPTAPATRTIVKAQDRAQVSLRDSAGTDCHQRGFYPKT